MVGGFSVVSWTISAPGSGKRYVHGGISLQEVVVPVIKIHKARVDDTGRVEVELLRVPAKITTGQISISLFQDSRQSTRFCRARFELGFSRKTGRSYLKSRLKRSIRRTRRRGNAKRLSSSLFPPADAFNNQEVELRLEEKVPGTDQIVTYKTHSLKLQKPFASDFDEH